MLALDYFIDSLPDTDIRLRLREVGPKSINEAERIAVRLETHRIADKSRGRQQIRSVEQKQNVESNPKIDRLVQQMSELVQSFQNMKTDQTKPTQNHANGYHRSRTHGRNSGQYNNYYRHGENHRYQPQRYGEQSFNRNEAPRQNGGYRSTQSARPANNQRTERTQNG